jgi:hypothetical protein
MQITVPIVPVPPDKRGGSRRHERAVGCGGRGARNRRGRAIRTAKSCGPDAPMAGVKFARSSRFLGATVTNKLWSHRGEHEISRKPLRREGRTASAEPVCSCAFCLLFLHTRPRVQRAPGLPCALFLLGRTNLQSSGEIAPRECGCTSASCLTIESGRLVGIRRVG